MSEKFFRDPSQKRAVKNWALLLLLTLKYCLQNLFYNKWLICLEYILAVASISADSFSPWDHCEEERWLITEVTHFAINASYFSLLLIFPICAWVDAQASLPPWSCIAAIIKDQMGWDTALALHFSDGFIGFCKNSDFHVLKLMDFTQIFKYEIAAVLFYWVSINGL